MMNEQQAKEFELSFLKWARECNQDQLEIAKQVLDYVVFDNFIKEQRLRGHEQ